MENQPKPDRKQISRRDLIFKLFPSVVGGAAIGVAGKKILDSLDSAAKEAQSTPTVPSKPTSVNTDIPTQQASATSPNTQEAQETPQPEVTKTPGPVEFKIGDYDLNQPFVLKLPKETAAQLGYGAETKYHEDVPLPQTAQDWSAEADAVMHSAGLDNSKGNPFTIYKSDSPDITLMTGHSYQVSSMGQLPFFFGGVLNKGNADALNGKPVEFDFKDGKVLKATVAGGMTIPAKVFEYGKDGASSWGYYDNTPLFVRTDVIGVPDEIRNDKTPGVHYIALASCQSDVPGTKFYKAPFILDHQRNSLNRTIVFLRVDLNNQ